MPVGAQWGGVAEIRTRPVTAEMTTWRTVAPSRTSNVP